MALTKPLLSGLLFDVDSERVMKTATNFGRDALLSLGTCVGRFTKTERFHISITFLDFLAQYAKVSSSADLFHPFPLISAAGENAIIERFPSRLLLSHTV